MRRAFIPQLPSQGTDSHPPASASVGAICRLGVGISRALESRGAAGAVGLGAAVGAGAEPGGAAPARWEGWDGAGTQSKTPGGKMLINCSASLKGAKCK